MFCLIKHLKLWLLLLTHQMYKNISAFLQGTNSKLSILRNQIRCYISFARNSYLWTIYQWIKTLLYWSNLFWVNIIHMNNVYLQLLIQENISLRYIQWRQGQTVSCGSSHQAFIVGLPLILWVFGCWQCGRNPGF